MIKTPLSTVIGGAGIWTPGCTVLGGQQNIHQFIKSLFADGTQGIYLNAQDAISVSDLSSIKDLSGRNNHAEQPNSTSRASLITDPSGYKSLKFDGVDDGYVTPSIDFTATDKVTVIAAISKLSDEASYQIVYELSVDTRINNGSFSMMSPGLSSEKGIIFASSGTSEIYANIPNYPAPINLLTTVRSSIGTPLLNARVNGIQVSNIATSQGTGNYGNYPLYIGRRGGNTFPFNGQIYALLVIGKLLDDATTQRIEKEFAKYIGVTL